MMMIRSMRVVLLLLCAVGCSLLQVWAERDPCLLYTTYTDRWRDPAADAPPVHCDRIKKEGWYTFHLGDEMAYIPTTCMQDNTCGGQVSRHVDLRGQVMPGVGQTINASLCASAWVPVLDTVECCVSRESVRIKHCANPEAFIYYLKPQTHCPVTTCAILAGDKEVDRKYRFEPGDVPRSLQTTTTTAPPDTTTADVNECRLEPSPCQNGTCINTPGGYTCQCHPGFEPDLNETVCRDLDECSDNTDSVCDGEPCHNTPGSYFCSCSLGFKWGPDTQSCVDIDECREIEDVCQSPNMTCNNTEGHFTCHCAHGYVTDSDSRTCFNTTEATSQETTTVTTTPDLQTTPELRTDQQQQDTYSASLACFTQYLPVLIAIIVVAVLCLLIYVSVRLCRHYGKRGTWVPPPDQKGDEEAGDIKASEGVNGSQPGIIPDADSPDKPDKDEGGWWVVPLDQAPGKADDEGKAPQNTVDTRM